jgi:hypothetical protein
MKRQALKLSVALSVVAAMCISVAMAADKPAGENKSSSKTELSPDEMMKKMEVAGKPGPAHKVLDALAGEWNVEARFWMAPDAPPTESKGTSSVRWIHGGRFVHEDFSGTLMGKPFHGTGITGYDNTKQKYVNVWLDDMATGIVCSDGTLGSDGKALTFEGKIDCPITGEKDKRVKTVLRIESRDKHTLEMHDPSLGDKSKTGEIVYTRK